MKKSDFYYDLPQELIAQDPLEIRSSSRLMHVSLDEDKAEHLSFDKIKDFLHEGDCLVLNDTRVIPARLLGQKAETGGAVEVLLLKRHEADIWEALVKPGKKCRVGAKLEFGDGRLKAEVTDIVDEGNRLIKFSYEGIWEEVLDSLGEMPLPPYITHKLQDKNRYQTVYAKNNGSAAAPTAGLHFTKELLGEIEAMGVKIVYVTLHVGLGTFRPVKEDEILNHHMHSEFYQVSQEAADTINAVKASGNGRVICVGTTSCRTIESASVYFCEDGREIKWYEYKDLCRDNLEIPKGKWKVKAGCDNTEIFIYPGYEFKALDGLVTNFHLPESTLIMLVSALAGREKVLSAYNEAVNKKYRFFSFGDAMILI